MLAIVNCNTTWPRCIDDIVNLMSNQQNDKFILYGLDILEAIARDLQNMIFEAKV